MKPKFLAIITLAIGIFISGATSAVMAQDVWAYTYNSGSKVYIMTETIKPYHYRNGGFSVTTKTVESNGEVHKTNYTFELYGSNKDCNVYIENHFACKLSQGDDGLKNIFAKASEYFK